MPRQRDEPPQKISKLAIAAETDSDRYDTETHVRCYDCRLDDVNTTTGKVDPPSSNTPSELNVPRCSLRRSLTGS